MSKKLIIKLLLLLFSSKVSAQNTSCDYNFPVKVEGNILVMNDNTGRRFFMAGMVDNDAPGGMQLSKHDPAEMRNQLREMKRIGCNTLRWNAFLKGLDFTWDTNGNLTGVCPDCLKNLKEGLDIAYQEGILVQVVLSTGHFLKYGFGGANHQINGILNIDRVNNNLKMMSTEGGTQNYIDHVIIPMCNEIGIHPALFGFVIINEAYGLTDSRDTPSGSWTDETVRLNDLRRHVNRVSGALHRELPGVICSVSGLASLATQYANDSLIKYGGDNDGILDINQMQYYPQNHSVSVSPFSNMQQDFVTNFGGDNKPSVAGEFPMEGIEITNKNPDGFTLSEAYESLWNGGYSGGFTWSNVNYFTGTATFQTKVESHYQSFNTPHLSTLDLWENWSSSLCNTVSIEEDSHPKISIYPNPADQMLYFSSKSPVRKITVFNAFGSKVLVEEEVSKINIAHLPQGIYFVELETEFIHQEKLMIHH